MWSQKLISDNFLLNKLNAADLARICGTSLCSKKLPEIHFWDHFYFSISKSLRSKPGLRIEFWATFYLIKLNQVLGLCSDFHYIRDDLGILSAPTYLNIMSELSTVQDKVDVFPTISALLWFNWNVQYFPDRFGTKIISYMSYFLEIKTEIFSNPG